MKQTRYRKQKDVDSYFSALLDRLKIQQPTDYSRYLYNLLGRVTDKASLNALVNLELLFGEIANHIGRQEFKP